MWSLLAICLAYFLVILDATVVTVALPSIGADLGGGVTGLEWVVDGYTLAFAALLLTGGALADRLGPRRLFFAGLLVFAAASAACALAPSATALVLARVIQGCGAALMVPASLALIRVAYPAGRERAKAIGVWGAVAGVAAAAGPVVGGLLTDALSWRAVFVVNVPLAAVAVLLAGRFVPAAPPDPRRGLDPAAQLAGTLALGALTLALIEAGARGWTAPLVLAAFAAAPVAMAGFAAIERRARAPMLPLGLLGNRPFAGACAVGLLINLGFYGQLFVMSLAFQQQRGFSAVQTGVALLPEAVLVALSSALSGRLTARAGTPRPVMLAGLTLGAAGLTALALQPASASYALLVVPLMATGSGMALTMPAATTASLEAAPAELAGVASGALNAARQVGGAIGVALLGTLAAGAGGTQAALAVAAAAFVLGAAVAALAVRPRYETTWTVTVRSRS
jgi:DHA2 family methylenomycin A resistance protein-like MFS transporter